MLTVKAVRTVVVCVLLFVVSLISWKTEWLTSPGNTLFFPDGLAFAQDEKATAEDEGEKKPADGKADKTPCPECPDPAKVVLEGLEEKRAAIAMDQERLDQEKKRLETFKEEIDEKLAKLDALKQQIDADLARIEQKKTEQEIQKQAAFDAKMNRLVKMYSGMKPKKAAAIVDKMDIEVAKQIFSRMGETSAGQILAFVDSERAAKISERIAFKKP
jgi:flagellar motility protein MotE (MotC chaperone)